jgi:hypothetical protein
MKIARIPINRTALANGIESETFQEMIKNLPPNSKIVGMGSASHEMVDYLFVENSIFKDTPDGSTPPDIEAMFSRRYDGTTFCSGVNWNNAMPSQPSHGAAPPSGFPMTVNLSPGYGIARKNVTFCPKAPWPKDTHEWTTYVSQFKSEEICKFCGDPKP